MVDAPEPIEGWYVHLSVRADEGGRLLEAAPGIVDDHGASLVVSPNSRLKELVLFAREDDAERARGAVIDVYQRLRRLAGLDAQPARVVALVRPQRRGRSTAPKHRRDVRLMREAHRVLNTGSDHEWVVVLAQTACEVYVRDILDRRAAQLGEAALERVAQLPSGNLDNERVRSVFEEMTGYTPPEQTEWWSDYEAHVQRRHRIVHAGARVTRADAESSIRAAEAMIAFLHWPSMRIESRGAS
jgi:hypothetical protein